MGYESLVSQNPFRVLKTDKDNGLKMGLVMARAGVGKTALLVQIALDSILRGNKVLHVSIGESIDKTRAWYDDMLELIVGNHRVDNPQELADSVARNRIIMTFKESAFSRPKLEERLNDLILQDIFRPDCLVIDGFNFDEAGHEGLEDIRELAGLMNLQVWFSATSHRYDTRVSESGVPAPCHDTDDLFDTIIVLQPEEGVIRLNIIKDGGQPGNAEAGLNLDPATMMIEKA